MSFHCTTFCITVIINNLFLNSCAKSRLAFCRESYAKNPSSSCGWQGSLRHRSVRTGVSLALACSRYNYTASLCLHLESACVQNYCPLKLWEEMSREKTLSFAEYFKIFYFFFLYDLRKECQVSKLSLIVKRFSSGKIC